jgi:hypothetical protein
VSFGQQASLATTESRQALLAEDSCLRAFPVLRLMIYLYIICTMKSPITKNGRDVGSDVGAETSKRISHHLLIVDRRLSSLLPEDVCNHIYEYFHPYKHIFTENIIKTHEIWKRAWIRFYHIQIDPKIRFVMEYILKEINVIDAKPERNVDRRSEGFGRDVGCDEGTDKSPSEICHSMKISLFPDTCSIGYYPNKDICSIVIIQMKDSDQYEFKEFELFTTKQYKTWCLEECSSANHKITIYWSDHFWLVQTI